MANTTTRRETIPDELITEDIYFSLIEKMISKIGEDVPLTQKNIIKTLLPMKISNATIARIINDLIPNAKATQGSVASQLRNFNRQNSLLDELLKELES